MGISPTNQRVLGFLSDIYEVSQACSTKTWVWGGLIIDILQGRFLREHRDIDGFTEDLLALEGELAERYRQRGYDTRFLDEWHILRIEKDGVHAAFNRLDADGGTAMWRHIGEHGTVYFPYEWLDTVPRKFYDVPVYTSGIPFDYAIKTHVRLLSPEWQPRDQDREAVRYLSQALTAQGVPPEDVLGRIWSYNPFWARRGYAEYAMPIVAWSLSPPDTER